MKKKITTLLSLFAVFGFLGAVAHAAVNAPPGEECPTCDYGLRK